MNLNPQQKLAVQADDKPLLIVAGAGTGKTRTLTGRLAYLIEKGIPPDRILALTFTNKAAKEMAERVLSSTNNESIANKRIRSDFVPTSSRMLDFVGIESPRWNRDKFVSHSLFADDHSPFIGTFHSLGARILRVEAKLLGRDHNFAIFDDSDSLQIIKKLLKTEVLRDKEPDYSGAADISRKISRMKNNVVSRESILSSSPDGELVIKLFHRYEKELQKNNAFDFDDLIEKVVHIFKTNPNVLEKYRKRYRHILIDEYQDLNNKQYEMVKLLVGDSPRISVVGDDQQMIYSFRGSNFRIFMDFEKDWPDANVILLEENYRSTSNIISAASALISNNINQKPKTLWTKKEDGAPVKIIETSDEESEAEWITEQIANSQWQMANGNKENQFAISNSQFAVLYRTNAQSRAIEQELIERGISYRIFGGLRFYERKEIKDIVAALRYAQNNKDEVSRDRLEKNIAKGRFLKYRESLDNDASTASPAELIHMFLESTGYLDIVGRNFLNADERRENIAELLHFASEFKELSPFLEQIALLQPMDNMSNGKWDKENGKQIEKNSKNKNNNPLTMSHSPYPINLMTIHLAKGLEFDRVFIAGCNEGILPHSRALGTATEIEEERRLMYVAMTRAKKELFLSFYDIPSRFLGELPNELVEFKSLVSETENFSDSDDEERYITFD